MSNRNAGPLYQGAPRKWLTARLRTRTFGMMTEVGYLSESRTRIYPGVCDGQSLWLFGTLQDNLFNIDSKTESSSGGDAILRVFLKAFHEELGYSGDHSHTLADDYALYEFSISTWRRCGVA